ncbi:hypothetical protein NECAME_03313 [Necator americanus]|uniref:M protein repeat protein n=1 Tax=Necator americanus TaxID=51031 RepID=W2T5K7_NECAM|nr:hypothetical protein NECAME_03313 [Necator americanus]ETN76884.1 hypothetical protein NECAME_03313 [Necator americanus]
MSLKKSMGDLRDALNLKLAQCEVVGRAEDYIENLEDQLASSNLAHKEKTEQFEARLKELQTQIEVSYSKQKRKKELQIEVEELRKKLTEIDAIKEDLTEEMRTTSKELTKVKCQLQTKEGELERERKLAEGLNEHLQRLMETHHAEKDLSRHTEEELKKTKELYETSQTALQQLKLEKDELNEKYTQLSSEYEKFKEEQRPSIRTELERRYEDIRYRLNIALEKIHEYELVLESAKKGEDTTFTESLQHDLIQLKEYNAHLERQFQTQTEIIEALKRKLIEQKSFADLVHKLSEQDDMELIEDGLINYTKSVDRETGRLAESIAYIIKCASKIRMVSPIAPLEISTAHHKICPYNSVDSSGKWLSNSSEDISPDSEGAEWNMKRKSLKEVQCGDYSEQRNASTKSA